MAGPLAGIRIVELAGLGPAPFCGMMLADHGADVIRIERINDSSDPRDPLARGRIAMKVDIKNPDGAALVRELAKTADGLMEGFRPGVMERLGLGPDILLADNPLLVYGRVTGWGQFGPYARAAGHDINYIALSGALHTCGRRGGQPTAPVNYLGDFGGGGMMLAFGMLSALLSVKNGGKGQVIDCAMTDGSALLMGLTWGLLAAGRWTDKPGVNLLDSGAHFYDTYETADGRWISLGSIEPQFYALLREKLHLTDDPDFDSQNDPNAWVVLKAKLSALFKTKTREEWCALLEATDVCFAPVLSLSEAPAHPHNAVRGTYIEVNGATQPAPAPRYSVTATDTPRATTGIADTDVVLRQLGYADATIARLRCAGVIG